MTTIEAIREVDADEPVVTSGEKLGRLVVDGLKNGQGVTVSFAGLRGVPSSFFNSFVQSVVIAVGADAFENRVVVTFDSSVQQRTFERSLQATLAQGRADARG